jgi:hypothetical protein
MQFRTAMTLLAVILGPMSLVMLLAPTVLGGMMGLPLDPALAELCSGHETAKMEMVRVLGAWQLTMAIMVVVIRDLKDPHLRRRLLQAVLLSCLVHVAVSLHTLQIGNVSSFGWIPVGVSLTSMGVCLSVFWGRVRGL